jgi:hypothetical protein
MVNLRKTVNATMLYVGLPLLIAVVGGYIVERIKGTPPNDIAAALWHPFGTAISGVAAALSTSRAWLSAPVQLTHLTILVLLAICVWLARVWWRHARTLSRVDRLVFYDSLGDLTEKITSLQKLNDQVAADKAAAAEPARPELSSDSVRVLQMLASSTDAGRRAIFVADIQRQTKLRLTVVEMVLNQLRAKGFIHVIRGYGPESGSIRILPAATEWLVKNNLVP